MKNLIRRLIVHPLKSWIGEERYARLYYKGYCFCYYFAGLYFDLFQKVYRVDGLIFHVPRDLTDRVFRGRFALNNYEADEQKHLKTAIPPAATVLELGACLGVVSCCTNQLLAQPTRHVVLEPNPRLAPWIEKNRAQNRCQFHFEPSVISSQPQVTFYLSPFIVAGSAVTKTSEPITVPGKTVDQLETQYGLRFDTLIMDIEGAELSFTRENAPFLQRLARVLLEVHPGAGGLTDEEVRECEDRLRASGLTQTFRDGHFQIWTRTLAPANG